MDCRRIFCLDIVDVFDFYHITDIIRQIKLGAIQIIGDSLGEGPMGTRQFHYIRQGGGMGLTKVSRNIFPLLY